MQFSVLWLLEEIKRDQMEETKYPNKVIGYMARANLFDPMRSSKSILETSIFEGFVEREPSAIISGEHSAKHSRNETSESIDTNEDAHILPEVIILYFLSLLSLHSLLPRFFSIHLSFYVYLRLLSLFLLL